MPNWCDNELTVKGKKEELNKFKEFAKTKEGVLDEEKFIPYPEEYRERDRLAGRYDELKNKKNKTKEEEAELVILSLEAEHGWIKDGFNMGGHEWCCANWGTKWGICHSELKEEDENELFYYFDTAWSPPIPIIIKMSEMFPKLKFNLKYYEGGMRFCGSMELKEGCITKDKYNRNYKGGRGG